MATKEEIWKCAKKFLSTLAQKERCRESDIVVGEQGEAIAASSKPDDDAPHARPSASTRARPKRGGRVLGKTPKKSTGVIKGTDGSATIVDVDRKTCQAAKRKSGEPLPISRRTARDIHRMMEQANVQLKQPYRELGAVNRSRITAADLTRFTKILHSPAGQSVLTQGESPLAPQSVHQTARPTPGVPSPTAKPSTVQPRAPVPPVSLSEENLRVHDRQQSTTQVSSPPAPTVTQEDEDTDYESVMDDEERLAAENDRTREEATPVGAVKRTALADDGEPPAKKSRLVDEAPVNVEPARAVKRSREEAGQDADGGLLAKRPMPTDATPSAAAAGTSEQQPMDVERSAPPQDHVPPQQQLHVDMEAEKAPPSTDLPQELMDVAELPKAPALEAEHVPDEPMDVPAPVLEAEHVPDELMDVAPANKAPVPALPETKASKRKADESLGKDPAKVAKLHDRRKTIKSIEAAPESTSSQDQDQIQPPLALPAPTAAKEELGALARPKPTSKEQRTRDAPSRRSRRTAPGVRIGVESVKRKLLTRQLRPVPNAQFVRSKVASSLAELSSDLVSHALGYSESRPGKHNAEALAAEIGHRLGQAAHVQAYKQSGELATARNRAASDTLAILRRYPARIKRLFKRYLSKGVPSKRPATAEDAVARELYHLAKGRRMSGRGLSLFDADSFVPFEEVTDEARDDDDDDDDDDVLQFRLDDSGQGLRTGKFDEPHFTVKMRGGGAGQASSPKPTKHLICEASQREALLSILASLCTDAGIVLPDV